ncbi:hypothetical protein GY45DRAFT_880479 [Cubamyces sp. BRFM 1775]|nr:hypothetical protein GY45DRAFT_880479 [Cubamyces sp. BRFM 1775]
MDSQHRPGHANPIGISCARAAISPHVPFAPLPVDHAVAKPRKLRSLENYAVSSLACEPTVLAPFPLAGVERTVLRSAIPVDVIVRRPRPQIRAPRPPESCRKKLSSPTHEVTTTSRRPS